MDSRQASDAGDASAPRMRPRSPAWWTSRPRTWQFAVFVACFVAGAGIAKWLALIPDTGISVWPPGGLVLGTLLLAHPARRPWWLLAAFASELVANALWFRNPFVLAAVIALGNCGTAVVGARLIDRFVDGAAFRLESLREVLGFVGFGSVVGPAFGATVGATALALARDRPFVDSWLLFWIGDATGTLVIAPLVVVGVRKWQDRTAIPLARLLEAAVLLLVLVGTITVALSGRLPLVYLVIPPLLWAAIRFHFSGAVLSLVVLAVTSAAFTIHGTGRFAEPAASVRENLVMLQLFLAISSALTLVVAAISRQNRSMIDEIRAANASLEERVVRRTAELRASEARFRQTADSMAQIVWIANADGGIEYLNRRWFDFVGATPGASPAPTPADATHPEDRDAATERWRHAMARGEAYEAELRLRRADGQYRWFLARALPMRDERDEVVRWFGTSTDIDDFKRLQQENERLGQLVANSNDFIGLYGTDFRTIYVNPAGLKMLGLESLADAQRLDARDMVDPEDLPLVSQAFFDEVERVGSGSVELRFRHAGTGTPTWIDYRAFPIRDTAGRTVALASVGQLAGKRREAQALQRQLIADLNLADQRKDEFLAMLAHELRNPLSPILNATQLLQSPQRDRDDDRRLTAMLQRQVGQMVRLVDDLLDISRVNLGKISLRMEVLTLAELIEHAIEMARPAIDAKAHRVEVRIAPDLPGVNGDRLRLTQILSNLINNACKFTDAGGHIEVRASRHPKAGQSVQVSVRDDGIGMDETGIARIFRMFAQVNDREHANSGLGIGLALARALAEMHGGTIDARSDGRGRGSEFVLTLPALDEGIPGGPPAIGTGDGDRASRPADATVSILVVDDNQDAALSLAMLLEMNGYAVSTASGGVEALAVSARTRPDVVVLDIGMPGMGGYEVAQRMRDRDGDACPRLIALTGWGQAADRERSRNAGFDAHLVKPTSIHELVAILKGWTPSGDAST